MNFACLQVESGPNRGQVFDLAFGVATIGRDQTNSIQLSDPSVSRRHAELHFRDDQFVILDLQSANGVLVNGKRVHRQRLKFGDQIKLGESTLRFSEVSETSWIKSVAPNEPMASEDRTSERDTPVPSVSSGGVDNAAVILKARSNLQVMYQVAMATGPHTEFQELAERLIELVFNWTSADRAVFLRRCEVGVYEPIAIRVAEHLAGHQDVYHPNLDVLEIVEDKAEGIFSSNLAQDERFGDGVTKVVENIECIYAPVPGRNDLIGIIVVENLLDRRNAQADSTVRRLDNEQFKMLLAIAHQAAVAFEYADYYELRFTSERATAVGQILDALSHYMKNILQSINGGTHLIEDGIKHRDYDRIEMGWQLVRRNQDALSSLVMDMIDFGKPVPVKFEKVHLGELIERVVNKLQKTAAEQGVRLDWQKTDLPELRLDRNKIETALRNLILTEIHACRGQDPGIVEIRAALDGSALRIRISDNGVPLSLAELEGLFDPLAINERTKRTGLGLAVAKRSLVEHHGDVIARENPSGRGTLFEVILPASEWEIGKKTSRAPSVA